MKNPITADYAVWHPSGKFILKIAGKNFIADKNHKTVSVYNDNEDDTLLAKVDIPTWSGAWQERVIEEIELCGNQELIDAITVMKCIKRLKGEQV